MGIFSRRLLLTASVLALTLGEVSPTIAATGTPVLPLPADATVAPADPDRFLVARRVLVRRTRVRTQVVRRGGRVYVRRTVSRSYRVYRR